MVLYFIAVSVPIVGWLLALAPPSSAPHDTSQLDTQQNTTHETKGHTTGSGGDGGRRETHRIRAAEAFLVLVEESKLRKQRRCWRAERTETNAT